MNINKASALLRMLDYYSWLNHGHQLKKDYALPDGTPETVRFVYKEKGMEQAIRRFVGEEMAPQEKKELMDRLGIKGDDVDLIRLILSQILDRPDDEKDLDAALYRIDAAQCKEPEGKKPAEKGSDAKPFTFSDMFSGNLDFRLRYQGERKDSDAVTRNRGRYRMELAAKYEPIKDWLHFNVSVATGGTDPRSLYNTMQAELPSIMLGGANAVFTTPEKDFTLAGGRFYFPFFRASDMVFANDIRWEGAYSSINTHGIFVNGGIFSLRETKGAKSNPYLFPIQVGYKTNVRNMFSLQLAAAFIGVENIQGAKALDDNYRSGDKTNETVPVIVKGSDGKDTTEQHYKYGYNSGQLSWDIGFNYDRYFGISHYGEFIKAFNGASDNAGYLLGLRLMFLDKQLKFDYSYRRLGREATLDAFPDPDCYGGDTDVSGHKASISGTYYRNNLVEVGGSGSFYHVQRISGDKNLLNLWQINPVNIKVFF